MKVEILGVKINNENTSQITAGIIERIRQKQNTFIATPNPEMLVLARRNNQFKNILNAADIAIPDGFGLILAAKFLHLPLKEKVSGADLVEKVIKECGDELRIFLLGAEPGVGERAGEYLKRLNPAAQIVGIESGGKLNADFRFQNEESIIQKIKESSANLLLIAFGQVKQEIWIYRNLQNLQGIAAVGIGGALDFYAGKARRAPDILRRLGLEWFWRLLLEPKRIRRIINAVIVFPYLVLKYGRK
ncbi:MAG: WecB/TagA/CpsF family glycosyltransferase [Patescibacteria group bacterium]